MELPILSTIAIIFGLTVLVIIICNFFKIPHLIGYLLTGILISPNTSRILGHVEEVEVFAEIGVILLLFTIGLEFSIKNLLRIKRYVLLGGSLQVAFTIALAALVTLVFGLPWQQAVFVGFVVCLSSTAIVVKILQDKIQINTDHGKVTLAMLLFQDIVVVPMILVLPILSGQDSNWLPSLGLLVIKLAGLGLFAYVISRWIIPRFLYQVMKIKSQEVFLIATIFIVAVIALLTSSLGLSLALGAFIAGLIVSETDYNRLAISCILPFRYVFISFFFISMGMLLDWHVLAAHPFIVGLLILGVLLIKFSGVLLASYFLKVSLKTALLVGFAMAQIGEFSFILSKTGMDFNLMSETNYQIFLAVAIATMAITPFLIDYSPALANRLLKRRTRRTPILTAGKPGDA
jgi:monovalent cation:H+ antiporter-2, CPA2 family